MSRWWTDPNITALALCALVVILTVLDPHGEWHNHAKRVLYNADRRD